VAHGESPGGGADIRPLGLGRAFLAPARLEVPACREGGEGLG
jgi:hypothetical protein